MDASSQTCELLTNNLSVQTEIVRKNDISVQTELQQSKKDISSQTEECVPSQVCLQDVEFKRNLEKNCIETYITIRTGDRTGYMFKFGIDFSEDLMGPFVDYNRNLKKNDDK